MSAEESSNQQIKALEAALAEEKRVHAFDEGVCEENRERAERAEKRLAEAVELLRWIEKADGHPPEAVLDAIQERASALLAALSPREDKP